MQPLVSIVTPCYNGGKYLKRFFDSILKQTYEKMELIFVNDGSDDDTEVIALDYKWKMEEKGVVFTYLFQEHSGQAAALNKGLKHINGKYLIWPDSDDELSPEYIREMVLFLEKHQECAYCHGKAKIVNEQGMVVETYGRREQGKSFFEDILYVRNVFFCGFFARMDAVTSAIPHCDIYTGRGGQNAQMLLPLAWMFGEPEYNENAVYIYYIHDDSHSHMLKSPEDIIKQLYLYERILIETIKRIPEKETKKWVKYVAQYYARIRYGNAIDTKDKQLIRALYKELKSVRQPTLKERLLYLKYTNNCLRKLNGVSSRYV